MEKPKKFPRPGYVTFISVTLAVAATVALVLGVTLLVYWPLDDPRLQDFQSPTVKTLIVAVPAMMDVAAFAMFLGANWGRMLYYFGCVPAFLVFDAVMVARYPVQIPVLVVKLIIQGIYCAALATVRSNFFFTGRKHLFPRKPGSGGGRRTTFRQNYDY